MADAASVTLWSLPASHPVMAAQKALELKGVTVRRIDYVPALHRLLLRTRFDAPTVPAARFPGGRLVQGSRAIVAAAEELWPEPPLFPADPGARSAVTRAEEWGDQVLQPIVRRLAWWCLGEKLDVIPGYAAGVRMFPPTPAFAVRLTAKPLARVQRHFNGVSEPVVKADMTHLPTHLDRVDAWIAEGVLDGDALNAADLQIAASLRLMLTFADLQPIVDARPCGALARRVFSDWTGATPSGAVPPSWLPAG